MSYERALLLDTGERITSENRVYNPMNEDLSDRHPILAEIPFVGATDHLGKEIDLLDHVNKIRRGKIFKKAKLRKG